MATHRFQVTLEGDTGLPEDSYVNVLYYDVNAPDTVKGTCDAIIAVYTQYQSLFPSAVVNDIVVRAYALAGGPPEETSRQSSWATGTTVNPYEVACCLSYYADDNVTGIRNRRGRIYVGPLAGTLGARPDGSLRSSILAFGAALAEVGFAGNTTWMMLSNTGPLKIERIAVDDAWDTQRRRGLKPSTRQFADVQ